MDKETFRMKSIKSVQNLCSQLLIGFVLICCLLPGKLHAGDLDKIRDHGVLRHLGIPYANFVRVTEQGADGLDVELMQLFAQHLGVRYELVTTSWSGVFSDLTGELIATDGDNIKVVGNTPIKGDIIANGLTILPYRQKIVEFSVPTFPTGVWLVARSDSTIKPIRPTGDIVQDIQQVRTLLPGRSVLSMKNTCLDPDLYDLDRTGAEIRYYTKSQMLDEIAPAVLDGMAETTLLDIPDALIALQKWPGDIKVIGPISPYQQMGVAVTKDAEQLLAEFNRFFEKIWRNGDYHRLVEKYYPSVFLYLDNFFQQETGDKS